MHSIHHIHLHDDFDESKVKRDKGKFAKQTGRVIAKHKAFREKNDRNQTRLSGQKLNELAEIVRVTRKTFLSEMRQTNRPESNTRVQRAHRELEEAEAAYRNAKKRQLSP